MVVSIWQRELREVNLEAIINAQNVFGKISSREGAGGRGGRPSSSSKERSRRGLGQYVEKGSSIFISRTRPIRVSRIQGVSSTYSFSQSPFSSIFMCRVRSSIQWVIKLLWSEPISYLKFWTRMKFKIRLRRNFRDYKKCLFLVVYNRNFKTTINY